MRIHLLVCLRALLGDAERESIASHAHVDGLEAKAAVCARMILCSQRPMSVAEGYEQAACRNSIFPTFGRECRERLFSSAGRAGRQVRPLAAVGRRLAHIRRDVSAPIPRSPATCVIGRPGSIASRTPRAISSSGYFFGRDIRRSSSAEGRNPRFKVSVKSRPAQCYGRRLLRPVRISLIRISGCSKAAKCPPWSASP